LAAHAERERFQIAGRERFSIAIRPSLQENRPRTILAVVRRIPGIAAIAFVLLLTGSAHAELWCGNGPGTPLDHPCDDRDTQADPAVEAAISKYENQWMSIHGVWNVTAGTTQTGDPREIRVFVEPKQLAHARELIPSDADGITVTLIARKIPQGDGLVQVAGFRSDSGPPDREALEKQEKAKAAEAAYSETMREYSDQWNDLPGVIGMGPAKCKASECDFSKIKITVQAQFMDDVREHIPSNVNGVSIVLVPYNGTDDD
jgi:hypothetical protein